MGRSGERLLMVLVGLVMLLVVAMVGFQLVSDRNRRAAMANFKRPAAIQRYETTRAAKAGKTPVTPAQGEHPSPAEEQPAGADASERIAAFAKAFARGKAVEGTERWRECLDLYLSKPRKEWTAEEAARVKAIVDEIRDLVHEIRRLAEEGGPAYELDYSKGFEMQLPHLAQLRHMARFLLADALVQGQGGNYGEVVEDVLAGIKLGGVPGDEPILISQLVRMAITAIAFDAAQQALPSDGLSADLARRVIDDAGRNNYRPAFAECFSGEAFFGVELFDQVREGGDLGAISESTSDWDRFLWRVYGSPLARPWLNMDEQAYVGIMSRISDASQLPYNQALPLMTQVEQNIKDLSFTQPVSRTLLPALTRAIEAQARNEAILDLLRLGLSVEQYRTQNGVLPATLDDVASTLGGRVPMDPFTGQPYQYKPSGGSFLLYSLGQNQVDDGGKQDRMKGDLVWRAEKETKQ